MIRINVRGKWITPDTLLQETLLPDLNEHEQRVIQLIGKWINGASEFTFQTSGSTGTPKQITFRRDQLAASALLTARPLPDRGQMLQSRPDL